MDAPSAAGKARSKARGKARGATREKVDRLALGHAGQQ
jgi:hypothetical protein